SHSGSTGNNLISVQRIDVWNGTGCCQSSSRSETLPWATRSSFAPTCPKRRREIPPAFPTQLHPGFTGRQYAGLGPTVKHAMGRIEDPSYGTRGLGKSRRRGFANTCRSYSTCATRGLHSSIHFPSPRSARVLTGLYSVFSNSVLERSG